MDKLDNIISTLNNFRKIYKTDLRDIDDMENNKKNHEFLKCKLKIKKFLNGIEEKMGEYVYDEKI